jgi:hypothetical protein
MPNLMLAPALFFTALDSNGKAIAGAKIYTLSAGGVWPGDAIATYSDVAGAIPNPNPVICDAAGRCTMFCLPTSYKFLYCDDDGVVIRTIDNVIIPSSYDANVDITGTAGEALAARDVVYLSTGAGGTTAGRWYKADADVAATSSTDCMIGVAPEAIASGAAGSVRLQGRVTGYVGLTPGAFYFASATAGGITASAPANRRLIGQADLSSSLVVVPTNTEITAIRAGGIAIAGQGVGDFITAASATQFARSPVLRFNQPGNRLVLPVGADKWSVT